MKRIVVVQLAADYSVACVLDTKTMSFNTINGGKVCGEYRANSQNPSQLEIEADRLMNVPLRDDLPGRVFSSISEVVNWLHPLREQQKIYDFNKVALEHVHKDRLSTPAHPGRMSP